MYKCTLKKFLPVEIATISHSSKERYTRIHRMSLSNL